MRKAQKQQWWREVRQQCIEELGSWEDDTIVKDGIPE